MAWASSNDKNQFTLRHSSRSLPWNDSIMALSVGFPGREKSSATPLSQAQRSRLFEMNSGPLSHRIDLGARRFISIRSSNDTTSSPRMLRPTQTPRHSRLKLSTTVKTRNRLPSNRASETKSMLQHSLTAPAADRTTRPWVRQRRLGRLTRRFRPSWQ